MGRLFQIVALLAAVFGFAGLLDKDANLDAEQQLRETTRIVTGALPTEFRSGGDRIVAAEVDRDREERALILALHHELGRVGCFVGDAASAWSDESRRAMRAFNDSVNTRLPSHEPDHILLTMLQGFQGNACNVPAAARSEIARATLPLNRAETKSVTDQQPNRTMQRPVRLASLGVGEIEAKIVARIPVLTKPAKRASKLDADMAAPPMKTKASAKFGKRRAADKTAVAERQGDRHEARKAGSRAASVVKFEPSERRASAMASRGKGSTFQASSYFNNLSKS